MRHFNLFLLSIVIIVSNVVHSSAQIPPPRRVWITEVFYNPPESGVDSLEFIELYPSPGWGNGTTVAGSFTSGIEYEFPAGFEFNSGEPVVVAKDSVAFESVFGIPAFQWDSGSLLNTGESVSFQFSQPASAAFGDSISYDNIFPWPTEADGSGHSLIRCALLSDGWDASNWEISSNNTGNAINGTIIYADPGQWVGCIPTETPDQREFQFSIYPNPATDNLRIECQTPLAQVKLTDLAGRVALTEQYPSSASGYEIDVSSLPSGIYLLEAITQDGRRSVQKVVVE